ncbi:hypothetical protein BV25DRAFT_1836406 [Artomyces pyxidatus]|uniref:Uncharacterized protein n=1 Tax=Artomyces pyxidatus TaxID=48021 RepID=A0ACB8TC89_9AGAM|nr:hypothetical protein BV25DRAFT_1836406 [Artomyces pyxidatus]
MPEMPWGPVPPHPGSLHGEHERTYSRNPYDTLAGTAHQYSRRYSENAPTGSGSSAPSSATAYPSDTWPQPPSPWDDGRAAWAFQEAAAVDSAHIGMQGVPWETNMENRWDVEGTLSDYWPEGAGVSVSTLLEGPVQSPVPHCTTLVWTSNTLALSYKLTASIGLRNINICQRDHRNGIPKSKDGSPVVSSWALEIAKPVSTLSQQYIM